MLRVLRLTPHFYHANLAGEGWPIAYDTIGGMQSQLYRQTIELGRLGISQTVMTLRIPGTPKVYSPAPLVTVRGVRIPVLPIRSRIRGMIDLNASWFLGAICEIVFRREKWDIIHVHGSGVFWPLLLGRWVSQFKQTPLVVTVHCSIAATYHPMNWLDSCLQPFARSVELKTIRLAEQTITLTDRVAGIYNGILQNTRSSVTVVPDCLDADSFESLATQDACERFRNKFNIPSNRQIVLYVGRVAHEKGWPNLLTLAKQLSIRPVHFVVCGDGNEGDELRRRIQQLNLSSRFTVTGYVSIQEIPAAMKASDVLVVPSLHEEFGSVLLEAMALKLPVVAFSVGGVPQVMPDGCGGLLVAPGEVDTMSECVGRVLDDKELCRQLVEKGYRRVREQFDLSVTCKQLQSIYHNLSRREGHANSELC